MKYANKFKIDLQAKDIYGNTGYQHAEYMVANHNSTIFDKILKPRRLKTISLIQKKMPCIAVSRPPNAQTSEYIHY